MQQKNAGFGFWTGWFVVAASMVGSGILTNSGSILKSTQSYPALFLLWTLGGLCAAIGAMALAELATGQPRTGGDYVFVREAFGPAVGFVYGWAMVLLGFAAPVALVAFTTVNYLSLPFGFANHTLLINLGATALIVGFTATHCFSHKSSAFVQGLTTTFKLGIFLLFAVAGFFGTGTLSHLTESRPLTEVTFPKYATGLVLVLYAYTGWNAAAYLAGEIRDAGRKLPWCLIGGTMAVMALYLIVNLFYAYALNVTSIAAFTDSDLNRLGEIAVSTALGKRAGDWFSLLVAAGVIASLSAYILTGPRIVYAMAKDKLFPKLAGQLHPVSGVPVLATVIQGAFAILFLWSGTFEEVLNFAGYGLTLLGMLVVAPIFVMRRRADFAPTFRIPGYPWTPLLFLFVSSSTLVGGAMDSPKLAAASVGSILMGFPLYYFSRRLFHKTLPGRIKE